MKVRKPLYKAQKSPILEGATIPLQSTKVTHIWRCKTSLQITKSPTIEGAKSPLKTNKVRSLEQSVYEKSVPRPLSTFLGSFQRRKSWGWGGVGSNSWAFISGCHLRIIGFSIRPPEPTQPSNHPHCTFWVDPKKRGGSKKNFFYFFMLDLDSTHKKNDRSHYRFFHPTIRTHPTTHPPTLHFLGGSKKKGRLQKKIFLFFYARFELYSQKKWPLALSVFPSDHPNPPNHPPTHIALFGWI